MPQLARDLTTRVQFLMATSELSLFEEVKEKFSPELLWGEGGCLANMRFSCVEDTGCAHNSKKREWSRACLHDFGCNIASCSCASAPHLHNIFLPFSSFYELLLSSCPGFTLPKSKRNSKTKGKMLDLYHTEKERIHVTLLLRSLILKVKASTVFFYQKRMATKKGIIPHLC
jgi:hypothetical protein